MSGETKAPTLAELEAVVRREPKQPRHWLQLGLALNAAGKSGNALECFKRATALDPGFTMAQYNCGVILYHQGDLEGAVEHYRAALTGEPGFILARTNLALALEAMGNTAAALAAYDEAISIDPNHPTPYWNKALLLLRNGELEAGWRLYEWRWSAGVIEPRRTWPGRRVWLGGVPIEGKTVLLHAEQGLGDMIQFVRFVPRVEALGAKVILETFAPLKALFEGFPGADAVLGVGEALPKFDLYCPLVSLPLALAITKDEQLWQASYLSAGQDRLAAWRARLGEPTRRRIGLVWKGNPKHEGDRARSIPLDAFRELFSAEAEFLSLQKEITDAERNMLNESGVRHVGDQLTDLGDTAAVIEACDLVLSVDTASAHLAGAMGKPVWVLLPARAEWRWRKDGETTPWYSTARLFRGTKQGVWQDVLQNVRAALA